MSGSPSRSASTATVRYAITSVTSAPCRRSSSAITSRPMSACGNRTVRPRRSPMAAIARTTPSALYSAGVKSTLSPRRATRSAVARRGLKVDLTPAEYRAEGVVRAIAAIGDLRGRTVLLPHADIGREVIADELRRQGAEVTEVIAYRTVAVEAEREGEPDIYRMLLERRIDVVTFTSASTVRSFVHVLGPEPAADLLRTTV